MKRSGILLLISLLLLAGRAGAVSSTNYKLKAFVVGGSGDDRMTSGTYMIEGTAGEQTGAPLTGSTYNAGAGYYPTQQANVPTAPTVTNTNNDFYNKLKIVVNVAGNPSDTLFAIAASTDDFVADTRYVQSNNTIGASLGIEDYQTYASWGGASGFYAINLVPSTTYYFKVKAFQGDFTETDFGPSASASTIAPYLTFDIDVASTDIDTDPPFTVDFGSLTTSVNTAADYIWVDFATNGEAGGTVYLNGDNGGLSSASTGYLITSATADLSAVSSGFGARLNSLTETSGGPLSEVSPYNGAGDNVGVIDTTIRAAITTTDPVGGGRGAFQLKARRSDITPAATDYQEVITAIASASF